MRALAPALSHCTRLRELLCVLTGPMIVKCHQDACLARSSRFRRSLDGAEVDPEGGHLLVAHLLPCTLLEELSYVGHGKGSRPALAVRR